MTAPTSAALGATTDPVALVPGSPAAVRALATTLTDWASRLESTGDDLATLRTPSWTGQGADSFWDAFGEVPRWWRQAADLLTEAAGALRTHADVVEAAQSRAQDAIDEWLRGESLTAQARTAHAAQVAQWREVGGRYPTFVDRGASVRREAEAILADARASVESSGQDTILALTRAGGGTYSTSGSSSWDTESSWSWGKVRSDQWAQQWGDNGWARRSGGAPTLGLSAVLASVHGAAWVYRNQGSFTRPVGIGQLTGDGSVELFSAHATGSLSAAAGKGLQAKLDLEANVAKAEGTVGWGTDHGSVDLSGTAQVGAYGKGQATFTTDGVDVSGEVLAGARVEGKLEGSVGGIGLALGAEGWAGAGAGAGARFDFEDGKWHIGANAGLAWGLGGKGSFGLVIDPEEMARTGRELWDEISGWW